MFKSRKMRRTVESHLEQVNQLLVHARNENLPEAKANYTSQKLALEHILREFDKLES